MILYFHGGAYALGSARAGAGLAADHARPAGTRVISVDYRLAPENPFPAAIEDAVAAYRALLDQVPSSHIAIAGESAGEASRPRHSWRSRKRARAADYLAGTDPATPLASPVSPT